MPHLLQIEDRRRAGYEPDAGNYRGCVSAWKRVSVLVEYPNSRSVRGTGARRPRGDVPAPDLAVYLLAKVPGIYGWPVQVG